MTPSFTFSRRTALRTAALAVGGAALGTLAACSSSAESVPDETGPLTLTFWHSASGAAATTLDAQVQQFNASNPDQITVKAVFQGAYADAMAKLSSAVASGDLPDLMQAGDVYTGFLADSGITASISTLSGDAATPFAIDNLVPTVRAYYSEGETLLAMPYQVSLPVLAVNTDHLAQANLTLADLAGDITKVFEHAKTLHAATGKPGLTFHINTWWNEEFTAAAGELYATPDNGRGGTRPTAMNLDAAAPTWAAIKALADSGVFLNVGSDGAAAQAAFAAGEASLIVTSSAGAGNFAKSNVKVEYLPFPGTGPSAQRGVAPGGNAVWVIGKGKSAARQQAAFAVAAFFGSDEVQKQTFTSTGYLPTTSGAATLAATEASAAQTALLKILADNPATPASGGCRTGAMGQVRDAVQPVLEGIAAGSQPGSALTDLEPQAATLLEAYNAKVGA